MQSTVKRLLLGGVSTLVQAAVLFGAAGRLDWTMGWAFVGVYAAGGMAIAALMEPELIAERAKIKPDARTWDTMLMGVSKLLNLMLPLVAGLDMRLGWTQHTARPTAANLSGLIFTALGQLLSSWAVVSNEFFSDVIRIQTDRGHTVISDGPYRLMRHPGYTGLILYSLAAPFLLDSPWALIPGGLTISLVIARTVVEDRTLLKELDGYQEYAAQVRYRLLPGVW
jgi:protein-S-isoprenylcysteine O-methyltransferase Ste14